MSVLEQAGEWPVDTVAVGVADAGGVIDSFGAVDEVLPWASVTKPVVAYAVLMAVDQEIVALDDPAGPEGSTVRHLLAHASGLPLNGDEPLSNPGRRRVYSTTGFEVLADELEERTGIPIGVLVAENVLEPLGMDDTRLEGSPGAGMEGTLADLMRFAVELLEPTLVGADLVSEATSVQFEGLGGVVPGFGRQEPNDWGLGFEIRDGKDPHWTGSGNSPATFGHFGQSGSFLWVDPRPGLACASLTDRSFGEWAYEAWPAISDAVLDEHGERD